MTDWDIHYVKTEAGRSIATGTMGSGPPVLFTPAAAHSGNFQRSGMLEPFKRFARQVQVVAYDHIGAGLSERAGFDYSPEGLLLELRSVADGLGLQKFALFGWGPMVHTAVRYAVAHSERLNCLALIGWPSGPAYVSNPRYAGYGVAMKTDWETASEYIAMMHAEVHGEEAKRRAAAIRETTSYEANLSYFEAFSTSDVSDMLGAVTVPTLVLQPKSHPFYQVEFGRTLAAGIPGARLAMVDFGQTAFDLVPDFVVERTGASAVGADRRFDGDATLSPREQQVLALIAAGKSNAQIAEALVVSEATAARHVHNILGKLGVANRTEAAAWWASRR